MVMVLEILIDTSLICVGEVSWTRAWSRSVRSECWLQSSCPQVLTHFVRPGGRVDILRRHPRRYQLTLPGALQRLQEHNGSSCFQSVSVVNSSPNRRIAKQVGPDRIFSETELTQQRIGSGCTTGVHCARAVGHPTEKQNEHVVSGGWNCIGEPREGDTRWHCRCNCCSTCAGQYCVLERQYSLGSQCHFVSGCAPVLSLSDM